MTTTKNNEHKKLNFSSEREQSQACLNSAEHEKNQGRKVLNVPNLRFKEFQGEWEKTKFGDIATGFDYGMNAAAKNYDGVNKYIRITDIDEASSTYTDKDIVSPDGVLTDNYLVNNRDILLARTGASTGKSYLYKKSDGKLYYAGFLIRANVTTHDPYFVFSQLHTHRYWRWVSIMSARSGQPGINSQEYSSFPIYTTSIEEESKIAKLLSLLDERIATQNKIIEDLKKLKSAISHILFSSKGAIHLSEIANVVMGQSPSSNAYNDQGLGMPLVQGNLDISNGKTTPRLYTAEFNQTTEKGNIILTVRAPVGEVAKATQKVCLGRGVCAIIPHEENMSDFIYQYLTFYKFMWRRYEQGSTFTSINGSDVRNIFCPKVRNVSILTLLDIKINIEERVVKQYQSQKQYMLYQMFI